MRHIPSLPALAIDPVAYAYVIFGAIAAISLLAIVAIYLDGRPRKKQS